MFGVDAGIMLLVILTVFILSQHVCYVQPRSEIVSLRIGRGINYFFYTWLDRLFVYSAGRAIVSINAPAH